MIQVTQLQAIMDTLESTCFHDVQSPEKLMEFGFKVQGWMSFSGGQTALGRQLLEEKKRQVLLNLLASLKANNTLLAPSLQKEYVNAACAAELGQLALADRCNRACVHALDLIRSCLSILNKEISMNR